jgi:uncharacterized protein YndB with AHSA1/START domain
MSDNPRDPTNHMRSIEMEIEVPGSPEEVWQAIATGPGIGSWYVPHTVEERTGGSFSASFGEGPEMQVEGRVAAWEPPHRIFLDKGEGVPGLAFEWTIEAKDGGTCIVRLVNSGFGSGESWDDQYDQMHEGWKLFLLNLKLHLMHFRGQHATASLPMAGWPGPLSQAWTKLTSALGIPASPYPRTRIDVVGEGAPTLGGTGAEAGPHRMVLLLDTPARGTGFLAAEGNDEFAGVSIWSYLYGEAGATAANADRPRWQSWLDTHAGEQET